MDYKIYCARPINGCKYDEVVKYYSELKSHLEKLGYDVLTPLIGHEYLRTGKRFKAVGFDNPASSNHSITRRDRWMVRLSDIIYTNLMESTIVSIGSVSELAWGYEKGKHTIVSMSEKNIHQHAFILEMADVILESHEEALIYLQKLKSGEI